MPALLIVNMSMAFLVLAISVHQSTQNALAPYASTLITIFHAVAAAGVALAGLLAKRFALLCLALSSVALMALPLSCYASGTGYPGGDDGGGFSWIVYVGCSSLLSMAVGVGTILAGIRLRARKQP